MPRLVSVAGGGDLGIELNLVAVSEDIEAEIKEYEPESYPALYSRSHCNESYNARNVVMSTDSSGSRYWLRTV